MRNNTYFLPKASTTEQEPLNLQKNIKLVTKTVEKLTLHKKQFLEWQLGFKIAPVLTIYSSIKHAKNMKKFSQAKFKYSLQYSL